MKRDKPFIRAVLSRLFPLACRLFHPLFLPMMKRMAVTGEGTDRCLEYGFLPVPVHYYQPVPDIRELERRGVWDRVSPMRGIGFEPADCLDFLRELALGYADECRWPNEKTTDPMQFFLHNGSFSYGCAAPLHCIIRSRKPKRIIEVGSGNSSRLIAAALRSNSTDGYEAEYTIIDPYTSFTSQLHKSVFA